MEKERFLRCLLVAILSPFVLFVRVVETRNFWGIRSDIQKCLEVIDSTKIEFPFQFLLSLIVAEDHRNSLHPGIDPIAVIRAVYAWLRFGRIQGASTIEQQFVRTVSGRYEKKISRKIREQIIAVAVSRRRSKLQIATAYLSIAFYGTKRIDIKTLINTETELPVSESGNIRGIIARLKYPEPSEPTCQWKRKINHRVRYIENRENNRSIKIYHDHLEKIT